jgi:hypothetical protein
MLKRIYTLFNNAHGKTLIKWHSSNQIVPPIFSFIDIFWDGENYGSGPHKVFEFYSKMLTPERMQAEHTGIPFGFAPDMLPELEARYAPTSASERNLMGVFMIHDGNVWPSHVMHPGLIKSIQHLRLNLISDDMKVLYYWNKNEEIEIKPDSVKYILHYNQKKAILILFNWSDKIQMPNIKVNLKLPLLKVEDAETETIISKNSKDFNIEILPGDFRILICQ